MGKSYEGPPLHIPPSQQDAQGPVPKGGEPVNPEVREAKDKKKSKVEAEEHESEPRTRSSKSKS
jgi:hypothetical protein